MIAQKRIFTNGNRTMDLIVITTIQSDRHLVRLQISPDVLAFITAQSKFTYLDHNALCLVRQLGLMFWQGTLTVHKAAWKAWSQSGLYRGFLSRVGL